ncbi:MAG: DnaD domain protein [Limnochordales bacterium]
MSMEGIRLDDGGARRNWPLMVPRALLEAYQPLIGPTATVLWLHLYSLAQAAGSPAAQGGSAAAPGTSPPLLDELARRMNVPLPDLQRAWTALQGVGLLRRGDEGWVLGWPSALGPSGSAGSLGTEAGEGLGEAPALADGVAPAPPWSEQVPAAAEVPTGAVAVETAEWPAAGAAAPARATPAADGTPAGAAPAAAAEPVPAGPGRRTAIEEALGAVVAFYHQRIGLLGPSQFERLRFWVEEQGMSPDVVALAIEETVQSARTPRMNYLEGVLRNWYNEGIRTLEDLQRSQRARVMRQAAPVEGAPNAGAYQTVDADAVRRWKEMFADEYDG